MTVGVGIVGMGFISVVHQAGYAKAPGAGVVAFCDTDPDRRRGRPVEGNLPIDKGLAKARKRARVYDRIDGLLADPAVDAVSLCTPTHTHVPLGLKVLAAGKHLLCEKPLAPSSKVAAKLVAAAKKTDRVVMVGHSVRFRPEYGYLKKLVDGGTLGRLRSLTLHRLGATPTWSAGGWMLIPRKSGGAALDLHIHDSDFVCHLLGRPRRVYSVGTSRVTAGVDHIVTMYRYADRKLQVTAEGGWAFDSPFAFRCEYHAVFENGSVEFRMGEGLTVYRGQRTSRPRFSTLPSHTLQIQHFIDCIRHRRQPATATPADGMQSVRIVEAELESCRTGKEVRIR